MNAPIPSLRYLWFRRGDLTFAAPMESLQEVICAFELRPLPGAEPSLAGLTVIRDSVLPIFDPADYLRERSARNPDGRFAVILSVVGEPAFGVLADGIGKVVVVPEISGLSLISRVPETFLGEATGPDGRLILINPTEFARVMQLGGARSCNSEPSAN